MHGALYKRVHMPSMGKLTRTQMITGQSQCENFRLVILIAVPLTGINLRGSPAICFRSFPGVRLHGVQPMCEHSSLYAMHKLYAYEMCGNV